MNSYLQVLENVEKVATKVGRDPKEILIVAVTKNHPWEEIEPLYRTGCRNFGENRVQEALPKIDKAPKDIDWHFIGTLQKNKVNKVVSSFVLIHSVDSFELAEAISKRGQARILLEVKTSDEPTKKGLTSSEWEPDLEKLFSLPNLSIDGLMTMAPMTQEKNLIRKSFSSLWKFREKIREKLKVPLPHLSMGMSNDYPLAIEEGATLLRIGSAVFQSETQR